MNTQRLLRVLVLIAVAAMLAGCPGGQTPATYKLHICVTTPFPPYTLNQLIVSPSSNPNSTDLTGALGLLEGNVLVVSGLEAGEDYDLSLHVSVLGSQVTWNTTAKTGVISGDVYWLLYADSTGGLHTLVNANPVPRALGS